MELPLIDVAGFFRRLPHFAIAAHNHVYGALNAELDFSIRISLCLTCAALLRKGTSMVVQHKV